MLRRALRRVAGAPFTQSEFGKELPSIHLSATLLEQLQLGDIIQPSVDSTAAQPLYEVGLNGRSVINASFRRPIHRRTAERLLDGVLQRAAEINQNPDLPLRVAELWVFGSYLGSSLTLGDLDLAVRYEGKVSDLQQLERQKQHRRDHAKAAGRKFRALVLELDWPETEMDRVLCGASQGISLHRIESEGWLHSQPHKVVFPT